MNTVNPVEPRPYLIVSIIVKIIGAVAFVLFWLMVIVVTPVVGYVLWKFPFPEALTQLWQGALVYVLIGIASIPFQIWLHWRATKEKKRLNALEEDRDVSWDVIESPLSNLFPTIFGWPFCIGEYAESPRRYIHPLA